jgi:hypothetical protein
LKLVPAKAGLLRHAHRLSCTLTLKFTPAQGAATTVKGGVSLSK